MRGTIVAASDPTSVWAALEALAVVGLVAGAALWRRAQAGTGAPEMVSRYRAGTLGCAFWALLVAVRLVTHAY